MPDEPESLTSEMLAAAFVLDAPVPCRHLHAIYAGRSTFAAWRAQGLEIRKLDGLGPCVVPSQFKAFLMRKWGSYAPPEKPL